jgi:hypothetical protein
VAGLNTNRLWPGQHRLLPRRRPLSVIRNGAALAVVMTFTVIVAALAVGYGLEADGSADPSGSSVPGDVPLPEPWADSPTDGAAPDSTAPASTAPASTAPASTGPIISKGPTSPPGGRQPTAPGHPTPSPTAGPTSPAFVPIAIQAEAPGNIRTGGAQPVACGPCAGGARVGYIAGDSQLFIDVVLPISGQRTIEITYESDGPRTLDVSAKGTQIAAPELTGPGWETRMTYQVVVTLPAGPVRIGFYNYYGPAPDIDLVVVR